MGREGEKEREGGARGCGSSGKGGESAWRWCVRRKELPCRNVQEPQMLGCPNANRTAHARAPAPQALNPPACRSSRKRSPAFESLV